MKTRSLYLALVFAGFVSMSLAGCVAPAQHPPAITNATYPPQGRGQAPGGPVDPKYTPDALKHAFRAACQQAGFRVRELAVDESEFPFLLHGVIDGQRDLTPLQNAVSAMTGYRYAGSATKRGDGQTLFAMDITPGERNPATFARLRSLIGFPPL